MEAGTLSYARVVGLLLHYYDGSQEVEETLLQAQGIPAEAETASARDAMEVEESTY